MSITLNRSPPSRIAVVDRRLQCVLGPGNFVQGNWKGVGTYSTLGLEIVLGVMLPAYVGSVLDRRYDTKSTFLLVGFFIGLAHGARAVWRALKQANAEADRDEQERRAARRKYYDERP